MTRSTARFATPGASRYLQQLCRHWSHRFAARFDARAGFVDFGESSVTMTADDELLVMTVAAPEAEIEALQDVVAEHLARFAHREGALRLGWARD